MTYYSTGQAQILAGLKEFRQHDARSHVHVEPGEPTAADCRAEELARIEDLMTTPPVPVQMPYLTADH